MSEDIINVNGKTYYKAQQVNINETSNVKEIINTFRDDGTKTSFFANGRTYMCESDDMTDYQNENITIEQLIEKSNPAALLTE